VKKLLYAISFLVVALSCQSQIAKASNFEIGALGGVGILNNGGGSPVTYGLETPILYR
jgi:hypothetical protein